MTGLQFTVLGYPLRLAHPEFLLGLLAALLVVGLAVVAAVRRGRTLELLFALANRGRAVPEAAPARHGLRHAFTGLALAHFAVALAQPQCGTHSELAKRYGIDLVIAVDASRSMLARDIKPSRLERAKLELSQLLDQLKGDRVGLVVFAGDAFTQCPLTTDYGAAKMFLRAMEVGNLPVQGTDIARALEESKELLLNAERGAKARAIVLLTDGEDTTNSAVEAQVDELRERGIKVFALGIGSTGGEPIPELDKRGNLVGYKKDRDGNTVMSRLDERGLRGIAERTSGRYIQSSSGGVGVEELARELDRLDKEEFESRLTVKYDERFQWAALPGVLLLLCAAALRPGRQARAAGGGRGHRAPEPDGSRGARAGAWLPLVLVPALGLLPASAHAGLFRSNHPKVAEGNAAFDKGDYEGALRSYEAARQELPASPELLYNVGTTQLKLGQHEEAAASFEAALGKASQDLKARDLYNLGNAFAGLNKNDEAIEAYRKALKADPAFDPARHNLEVLLRQKQPPKKQDQPQPDAGMPDAGQPDAGPSDAGQSDGGQEDGGGDAGSGPGDGGESDAGGEDAGPGDGGEGDGGRDAGLPDESQSGADAGAADGGDPSPPSQSERASADPEKVDKQDAERLLEALRQREKQFLMQQKKSKDKRHAPEKDW